MLDFRQTLTQEDADAREGVHRVWQSDYQLLKDYVTLEPDTTIARCKFALASDSSKKVWVPYRRQTDAAQGKDMGLFFVDALLKHLGATTGDSLWVYATNKINYFVVKMEMEQCVVCRESTRSGVVLRCDRCRSGCHLACSGEAAVPQGAFHCANCSRGAAARVKERR